MFLKLPSPLKIKKIETKDSKEARNYQKAGFIQRKTKSGKFILTKKLEKWELFQEKVRVFLDALRFEDIESGQASWLGRYQIDVVGGFDGTFLVFECKSASQPKLKKLTQEINIFAGKKAEIEQAIREKFNLKYNEVRFILALEDIKILEEDLKTAKENDIYIWGSKYLETGGDLYSIIGELAVHYLLKELKVNAKPIRDEEGGADYKVPSFRIRVGDEEIYNFYLSAEKLLNLVYVFRLQPGNENAYERFIQKRRIAGSKDEIGLTEFVNNGGFFKNNVVCSFEREVKFEPKPTGLLLPSSLIQFGILSIPKIYGTVWVIDGQHRIYGYARAKPEVKKTHIGIVAYKDADKRKQAKDFIDINQKQKPVDPSTLWDLLSQIDPYSLQGAITRIAKELNRRGIFQGKILIPGEAFENKRTAYPLNIANVCNTLYDRKMIEAKGRDNLYKRTPNVTDENLYPDEIIENAVIVLDQYFSLIMEIAEAVPDWRTGFIIQNNGFNVFMRLLNEILKFQKGTWSKQEAKELIKESLKLYFEEHSTEIKDIRISTSNEAGRSRTALDIMKFINQKNDNFGREFIRDAEKRERIEFEKSEPYQVIKQLENGLRFFIENSLKEISKNWWKERIPPDVQESAKLNLERNESPWPWVKTEERSPISYINFPDYAKIIQRKDNWRDVFQKKLKDSDVIVSKLRELENIRNKIAHMRNISAQEATTLRLYSAQILEAIGQTK